MTTDEHPTDACGRPLGACDECMRVRGLVEVVEDDAGFTHGTCATCVREAAMARMKARFLDVLKEHDPDWPEHGWVLDATVEDLMRVHAEEML